ncbi:MAG: hypothetical protein PHV03_01965 [Desulfitobacteriaceae bacterium]|nr:hypothetical protein [Desulfitobacteriaceae bacterium]MDD4400449.1 hypothetical protein [Desulfitobacteriaceae bacterium]
MGNKAGVRHYFAEGLTSKGYISLLPNIVSGCRRIYMLLGGPGTGKSTVIKVLGLEMLERGYEVDFLRSANEPDSLAGFIIREAAFVILNVQEISPLRMRAPGVIENFSDFTIFCDEHKLLQLRTKILNVEQELSVLQTHLNEILVSVEGYSKKIYANNLNESEDTSIVNCGSKRWVAKGQAAPWPLVEHALEKLQKSVIVPCFLHGLTTEGWLNLAPHYLSDFDQIRLEGKETTEALNWVLRETQQLGQIVELVLHPLNPDDIIGIVFPQRNLAIWQGNPKNLHDQGLDQVFNTSLKETLVAWHKRKSLLKSYYMETVNFTQVDEFRGEFLNRLLRDLDIFGE